MRRSNAARPSTLQITLRHGIWRVWRDGKFFGDYRARDYALDAAQAEQRRAAKSGGSVSILITPEASGAMVPQHKPASSV